MAGEIIEFLANGEPTEGYLAKPASGSGPAVVVLQEWWGLIDEIKAVCDRYAEAGFFALAPDLYHGETADQPSEAQQMMMAINIEQAEHELRGAVDHVAAAAGTDRVGTVGFCLGGGLSVFAASLNPKVAACVSYYYVMPHGKPDFSKIGGPVLMHFGTADEFIGPEDANALVDEMRAAGVDVSAEFYDGCAHAFANSHNRLGTYDEQAAELAWQRSVDFLRAGLA